jgi:hypothetical protein
MGEKGEKRTENKEERRQKRLGREQVRMRFLDEQRVHTPSS